MVAYKYKRNDRNYIGVYTNDERFFERLVTVPDEIHTLGIWAISFNEKDFKESDLTIEKLYQECEVQDRYWTPAYTPSEIFEIDEEIEKYSTLREFIANYTPSKGWANIRPEVSGREEWSAKEDNIVTNRLIEMFNAVKKAKRISE